MKREAGWIKKNNKKHFKSTGSGWSGQVKGEEEN